MNSEIFGAYNEFLSGKRLEASRRFRNLTPNSVVDRIKYLRDRCAGQKVLHIGCLDHPEIILRKNQNETWLHSIVSEISEVCIGVDNNVTAYDIARTQLGVTNIRLVDLSKPLINKDIRSLREIQWDLILCAEVLEHVTNHHLFLQNLRSLSNRHTSLVITGPNAFRFQNFVNTLRGFESVNSDHKYWFTFYTLSRLLAAHGWEPHRILYYMGSNKQRVWVRTLRNLATRMSPAFGDGLIIEARCSDEPIAEEEYQ